MSNRRPIFYDDARHYHYYVYEPPMSMRKATATIDAVAGTGVDTFVWGFGVGPTVFHDSKHADVFAAHLEVIPDVASWRGYENTMSLINRGCDPLDVMIDRAHEVGMNFIGSLRLTHSSNPADATNAHNWQFKIDHPEWVLKGDDSPNRKNAFNWIYPEVRAERFAIAEETLTRYDVDGLELDLTFDPYYFEADEVADNLHVLTDFIRDLRRAAKRSGEKRGKSIDIGARVFPTLKANNDAGFDVETWLQEGLLDFVVPNVYSHMPIDPDFPFEVLLDLARAGGCEVYPAMGSVLGANREEYAGVDYYRAAASAYWSRGADALYLPWFPWPIGPEQRQILSEIGDPDVLFEKPKRYYMAPRQDQCVRFGYDASLPVQIEAGADASPTKVCLTVAKDSPDASVTLTLKLGESTSQDGMSVSFNGVELSLDDATYTTYGYDYSTLELQLGWDDLVDGVNELSVAVLSRPAKLSSVVTLLGVELSVDYVTLKQP
ncbi:MAG: family 10 glycosylhydrolase [Dehalococcoidia bacterium]|nr:family 10 glycosylhydrolase [Dehalococcoidia bacterium]